MALQIDPADGYAWYNLGFSGGGEVEGDEFTPKQCFEEALCIEPEHADAWTNLGDVGGGCVSGVDYAPSYCYNMAKEYDDD